MRDKIINKFTVPKDYCTKIVSVRYSLAIISKYIPDNVISIFCQYCTNMGKKCFVILLPTFDQSNIQSIFEKEGPYVCSIRVPLQVLLL